jgi:hypothetical protein
MKNRLKKIQWELAKILRFDNLVTITPSMRCNQKCWYCCQNYVEHGEHPEQNYQFWIDLIKSKKLKVVAISGGECSLYPGVEHIINYCSENKILVNVITNLSHVIPNVKKSWRVTYLASYHEGADLRKFMLNYNQVSKDFYVKVVELHKGDYVVIDFAERREIKTDWKIGDSKCPYVNYYPDGTIMPKYKFDEKNNNLTGLILYWLRKISHYKERFNE